MSEKIDKKTKKRAVFGDPPESAPAQSHTVFPVRNNRLQYPDIYVDIDALSLSALPKEMAFYGQFFQHGPGEIEDRLIVFRYEQEWLFHRRTPYSDRQILFPWAVLPWLYESIRPFFDAEGDISCAHQHVKTFDQQKIMLLEVGMENDGNDQPGWMLYKRDFVDPTKVLRGLRHQESVMPSLFLSNIGLFEQGGIAVLESALKDNAPSEQPGDCHAGNRPTRQYFRG